MMGVVKVRQDMSFTNKTKERVEENKQARAPSTVDSIELEDDTPFVKFGTGVMITGEFPEDEGNPVMRFPAYEMSGERWDQGYIGLVLDDPGFVVDEEEGTENTVVVETADDDGTEYRVFNPDSKDTHEKDYGVKFSGDVYDGDKLQPDEFDEDRIVLVVSGSGSFNVAKSLDIRGITARQVWDDENDRPTTNDGLVEYNPDNDSDEPYVRYARNPQTDEGKNDLRNTVELRPDLFGTRIGLLSRWKSEVDEDVAEELESGERKYDSKYYSVFNMETEEILEPGDYGEPVGTAFLNWTYDEDFSRDDDYDAPDLTEEERAFVEQYREAGFEEEEETVVEKIEEGQDRFDDEPNETAIVEEIVG